MTKQMKELNSDDNRKELVEKFETWFKTTPYYSGENCTPKYETYRMMLKAYFKGFEDMTNIVYDSAWINDFGDSVLPEFSKATDIIYHDHLFEGNKK